MKTQGDYPPYDKRRVWIRDARTRGGGPVAGRLQQGLLVDETGAIPIYPDAPPPEGAWISGRLEKKGKNWFLHDRTVHTTSGEIPASRSASTTPETIRLRSEAFREIRRFFFNEGFTEVSTPTLVNCPAVEARLHAISADGRYLRTSPEIHLKRLLVAGMERIFEIGPAYRQEEEGRHHLTEFTILEWYRTFTPLEGLMSDCEALVEAACRAVGRRAPEMPLKRTSWRQVFRDNVGIDPFETTPTGNLRVALRDKASRAGLVLGSDPAFEDLCEGLFAAVVEPELRRYEGVFLTEFPVWTAALARTREIDSVEVADRFELYLGGIEIANAYHELNDPAANRVRLDDCNRIRKMRGRSPYPADENFFTDLQKGMPPASGAALGMDRLGMWLLNAGDIRETIPLHGR